MHSVLYRNHLVLLFKIREETLNCKDEISSLEYFSEGRKEMDSEQVWRKLKVCLKSLYHYVKYHTQAVETNTMPPCRMSGLKGCKPLPWVAQRKEKAGKCFVNESCYLHFEGSQSERLVRQTVTVWQLFPVLCTVELLWNTSFHSRGRRGWTQG